MIERFNTHDAAALAAFLNSSDRPEGTLSYPEVQGFLFVIASAPDLVPPSEWLPLIFGGEEPAFQDMKEADKILGRLMRLYNSLNRRVLKGTAALPEGCAFREDVLANLEVDAPIARWSRGFEFAHQWLREDWDDCLPEELDDELVAILVVLTFFASAKRAEELVAEATEPPTSLPAMAATIRKLFPDAITGYALMGRSIYETRLEFEQNERATPERSVRVGRNEHCPCGSGLKYKKCCGRVFN